MTRIFTTVLILIAAQQILAQTKIKGIIKDANGDGLPGVNIVVKGSYDGASSSADGSFAFTSDEKGEQIIAASFIGYKTFEQKVTLSGNEVNLTIDLVEEINQLDAVVISAGSFTAGEEKRRTILKPLDIVTTAGATADIAGVLNTLPGTQKVGETGRLFVRGGDGSETRTFIDGMVVLNAYGPSAPNTPSRGRFLPFMFKGTSFSTGGYSAEYGQALSSALVLNSKDKAEMNQTDVNLLSVGGDLAHTQVWGSGSVSGKIQYTNLKPYMGLINQRVDWRSPVTSLEGSTAFRQQVGKGMIKVFGTFIGSSFSLYNHDILDPNSKQLFDLNNNYRYGNVAYKTPINGQWDLRTGLSYSFNQNKIKVDGSPTQETEDGIHAKAVIGHSVSDKIELNFGGELIDRNYSASRFNDTTQQTLSASFHESIASGFAETEMYASNHFVTKIGARYEYNSLNGKSAVDPRISLAYKPGKKGQFAFAYGMFRQSSKNQFLRVNDQLNSERAEHFILNYQVVSDRKTFRVEAYYKKYMDLVKYVNGNPYDLTNTGTGYAKGLELFWRDNESIKNVEYWISYSYLDTKRDYMNYPVAAMPTFASNHNFSVVYKHFITSLKSQLGLTYSFASGRPYYNPNLTTDQFQSQRTPDYHDLSANVSYLPKSWLIVHFSCTNLLGLNNIFNYQYSTQPNTAGEYVSRPVRQAANHFVFLGLLITITKNKTVNQLPNL
ncbi:TonB-dependent receptor [Cytophagales bacterium WSM2-2]|nr:TonB-dependent receptor [Cytophagales bacterium WSM2-2]